MYPIIYRAAKWCQNDIAYFEANHVAAFHSYHWNKPTRLKQPHLLDSVIRYSLNSKYIAAQAPV